MVFGDVIRCIHTLEIWNLYALGMCHVSNRLLHVPYFHEEKTACLKITIVIYILRINCISYRLTMIMILSGP